MDTEVAGHRTTGTAPDLADISKDLAALKRDLADLATHLRSSAAASVGEAASAIRSSAGQFGDKTRSAYDELASQAERSTKAIAGQIEERPVISLLVAFAIGIVAGRIVSR